MAGRDEFPVWVETTLYDAKLALHNGGAGPRRAIWSGSEPVSVCGAWRSDMAFTVGLEHTSTSVDGAPRTYTLRATQVYRREGGDWKVAHRHADPLST